MTSYTHSVTAERYEYESASALCLACAELKRNKMADRIQREQFNFPDIEFIKARASSICTKYDKNTNNYFQVFSFIFWISFIQCSKYFKSMLSCFEQHLRAEIQGKYSTTEGQTPEDFQIFAESTDRLVMFMCSFVLRMMYILLGFERAHISYPFAILVYVQMWKNYFRFNISLISV